MSRIIQQIATVQFQVDNRKVTASMDALQEKAKSLNKVIDVVKQNIKDLGDVPTDNKFLLDYQKQLRQLNSDLKDVTTAQRDLMKGVKAADQLWKAAQTQNIESLSIKAIKAGQNGLRKRMENLRPELGGDEQKMYDAYKAVIDEAERVMNVFKSNYATVVQTIRDGGIVSEQAMKSTRDALRDLMEAEKEGTAEQRQLAQQYDFLNESLANVAEMRRREKGEIVNASDARREALKLTEDGIAAARRERDMADAVIAGIQQQKSDLDQLRRFHEDRIAQTEREIAANQRLEEAEQDRLADVEKAMRYTENEDRKEAIRLRKKADAAAEQAELLDAIARRNEAVGESQAKIDRSRQRANEKLAEYISLNQKAEQMEEKVAHQEERHAEAMDQQSERLRQIRAEGQRLLDQYEQQKAAIQNVDKAWADADVKQGEAEARKAQNQELTIKSIDDSIRKLKEANAVIDTNSDEWEENTRIIQKLQQAQDEISQKQKEMMGEWMSYAEAEKFAAQAGTEGFIATGQQMQQAQQALERRRDALIKSIQVRRQEKNMTDEQKKALADEEAQLKKVEAELKKVKFEMDHAGMSAKRMEEILENPRSAKNIEELGMAVKRSQAQLKLMEDTIGKNNEQYNELAKKTQLAAQRQKELEQQFKASTSSFEKAWSRLKTYVTLYVSAAAAIQKLTGSMGDLMELSDKMGEVRKTTGFTADEVAHLSENLKKLDVRTSLVDLMDISAKAGQLGLKTIEDVQGFTEAANKLMIALPEMGTEAATEMMRVAIATGEVDKIRKQMQEGTIEGTNETAVAMEKIASTIDRLRASSASTAPEITDFVKRLGAVGAQSGISIDQISALGSTVSSLGMRVEMSATALSRMIPAIKNNAFQVAKAIKVEPEVLRNLFEAGRGMEAILMIFQHIKDAGMDEDSIEKLLGMAGMQDVMKQLNQQGARAGIVFAGLSQNVDELRKQLGVAAQAYEENIAIQQEFDRMNETTAAKWERFKNEIEEAFVRDEMQRGLGFIIDSLRVIVNLLTGNVGPALQWITGLLHVFLTYFAVLKLGLGEGIMKAVAGFKSMGNGIRGLIANTKDYIAMNRLLRAEKAKLAAATEAEAKAMHAHNIEVIKAEKAQKGLNKAMIANIWTAVAAAIIAAGFALYNWIQNMREAAREAGRFEAEAQKNIRTANKMIDTIGKARVKVEDAEEAVKKARKELEEAKKANDGTAEAVKRLKDAETELLVQEEKKRIAMAEHKRLIEQFNTQYSKYLGFMLSEVSSNLELAKARDLVNAKLRETIVLKQQEAGLERVEKNMGEKRDEKYGDIKQKVYDRIKDPTKAARAMQEIVDAAQRQDDKLVMNTLKKYGVANGLTQKAVHAYMDELKSISDAQEDVIAQAEGELKVRRETSQNRLVSQVNEAFRTYNKNLRAYKGATGDEQAQAAAAVLQQMDTLKEMQQSASSYYKIDNTEEGKAEEARYKKQMGSLIAWQGYSRDELLKAAGKYYTPRKDVNGEITTSLKDTTNGGWGASHAEDSTDWKVMTAEQLVNRRKQMKEFVNAIQDDTDVTRVLKEDSALQKAIENGMSRDVRTVIEWYNDQRLKIQDELYKRHLTNTGDWLDPKKSRESWRKQLQMDLDNYLKMLDAYYTKRKAEIQEAGNNEGLTEAEIRNRTIANDTEWQQRRMELQQIYLGKREQIAKDEVTAIMSILAEMDEDTPEMVEKLIGKSLDKWKILEEKAPEMARRLESKFVSGVSQSMLKMQQIIHQQMKAIQDIIDKERPFNGITKNLRENLVTMDILTADMREEYRQLLKEGKDMTDFNTRQAEEEMKRTTFLLGEAEHAYTTTVEEVMERMGKAGMTAWAEEIRQSPKMQEALMAQLHQTYDAIQEAIKKEASLMKKQAETMWNNILLPGGDGKTTVKDAFEKAIAQLGVDQGRVSRANSLIGAGAQSERVADKLAVKQLQLQLSMQQHYYNLIQKQGRQRISDLERQIAQEKELGNIEKQKRLEQDKQHLEMSLRLALTKEQTEELKLQEEIIAKTEESQNRLYTQLKEWGDLIASSMQSVMEASNAGNAEYYNERAKMDLTGKGGPGAGTYIVIDHEGTEDARAHYEYLDERQALERQREIENDNAVADAWKKVMDDLNAKMNDQITDWMNAALQNASIDANTDATALNTEALNILNQQLAQGININDNGAADGGSFAGVTETEMSDGSLVGAMKEAFYGEGYTSEGGEVEDLAAMKEAYYNFIYGKMDADNLYTENALGNQQKRQQGEQQTDKKMQASASSMYAKMTQAANLYGVAYQAMSNDNLSASQKFETIAIQAVGQGAIAALTADFSKNTAQTTASLPAILAECLKINPIAGAAIFAALTAVIGGLMGLAASKVAKSKSEISQVTGASVGAGRLATGMMTYAEGNVNEFTDPGSLTPGRQYNVDGADGRTYRARYMGSNPKTHLTNGPEFHLAGERGREMIIDAGTTRQITMNENEIWHAIQTLSAGGRVSATRRRRGVRAFADGNVEDFEEVSSVMGDGMDSGVGGFSPEMAAQMQASLDRNSEVMERVLEQGIHAYFDVYGKGGLIDSYDQGKKTVNRHGERY